MSPSPGHAALNAGEPIASRAGSGAARRSARNAWVHRLLAALLIALLALFGMTAMAAEPVKTLRYAIRIAETGFDAAQVTDDYSKMLAAAVLEPPLRYAYMERPLRLVPNTTTAMPEVSADFRTFTFHIKPGIYFADDPAFNGRRRELTAADYIYTLKRHYDPKLNSGSLYVFENVGVLGLSELKREAMKMHKPFDYDHPVEGLKLLDRYTFQVRTAKSNPRLLLQFADVLMGAVAREVAEFYGDQIMAHPVGTGPFRLTEWRRSSFMAFDRNPGFREEHYAETAPAEAPAPLKAQIAQLQGRRLPMVDRVEVSVIEENQPRWLSFARAEADLIPELPSDFASVAIPHNKLSPTLQRQGVQMVRFPHADTVYTYFNMDDATVGGYTAEKVALRRAIALGVDVEKQISRVRRSQAIPVQGLVSPGVYGFDPAFKSEMGEFDRAKARALLDLYGFKDQDGDGWRDMPDGKPLLIEYATQTDSNSRVYAELWQKDMAALNIRANYRFAQFPENLKASRAGKLMLWTMSWNASIPDAEDYLQLAYGPNIGQTNDFRFKLPAYDELFERQQTLPDGPERLAMITQMQRLLIAYMPLKMQAHRIWTDLAQPWVIGYDRNLFWQSFWMYVDIDPARREKELLLRK